MKKRISLFLLGVILLSSSLPLSTAMIRELIHDKQMDRRYIITSIDEQNLSADNTITYKNHKLKISEVLHQNMSYKDPWDYEMILGNILLELDGKKLRSLRNYPIRSRDIGMGRYRENLTCYSLKDKKTKQTSFILLVKKNREVVKEEPNGDIVGYAPDNQLKYNLYSIDEKGKVKNETFSFLERNALQTELLSYSGLYPTAIGYYTDAWEYWPTLFFPWVYPFLTLIIGLILAILPFFIKRKREV